MVVGHTHTHTHMHTHNTHTHTAANHNHSSFSPSVAVLLFYNQLDIGTTVLTLLALNGMVLLAWYLGSKVSAMGLWNPVCNISISVFFKCFHSEPRMFVPVIVQMVALGLWIVAGIYFSKKIYNSGVSLF